jgi:dolichol-phosphate mannosyltransferase
MRKNKDFKLSVVVPIYNEEGNVKDLIQRIVAGLSAFHDYEVVLVDDGSTDNTLDLIKSSQKDSKRIRYISFSRNFGHQAALRAGLDTATGDAVISMDGDLQHPPELIPRLVGKWLEGYDVVYTVRLDDPKTPFLKRKTSSLFYGLMNLFSEVKLRGGVADFRLLDRAVLDVLCSMGERDLFMRGAVSWLGFTQTGIEYMPEERTWGRTKYTFKKMFHFALAGVTGFSVRPLQISTFFGFAFSALAFLYGVYAIYLKLFTTHSVSGWASLLTVILFIGGIQMVMIGILGEYLGRLFMESKKRPNYIVKERSND